MKLWPFARKALSTSEQLWLALYGGWASKTGQTVTIERALEVSTVLACARKIADGLAQVPLRLMREDAGSTGPAREHPLFDVLYRKPNAWQTSYEFRETLGLHCVLAGEFIAYKNALPGRAPQELIPLLPGTVTVKRDPKTLELSYEARGADGAARAIPASLVWHVRGPSWNSYTGLDPVRKFREAIGLAIATEESQARLHANGGNVGGLLAVEGSLSNQQYADLTKWIKDEHGGSANAWKTMILDRSAKYTRMGMSGVDSQHLETRRFQVEEICRALGVMPIMVGHSDKTATYASAEQMFLAHMVHTMAPWYSRVEQSIDCHLLTPADRKAGLYAKFFAEGMLRGAMKDRAEFLSKLVLNGLMTRNEARATLDLNALRGLDQPLTPVNMTTDPQGAAAHDEGAAA